MSKRKKNDLTFIWRWTRITRRETKGVLASIRKLKEVPIKFNSGHMLYSNGQIITVTRNTKCKGMVETSRIDRDRLLDQLPRRPTAIVCLCI